MTNTSDLAAALARIAVMEAAIRRWVEARGAYNGTKGQAKWFGDVVLAETALAALLVDAVAAGLAHPEATCQRCGRPNVVWHAPNEVWNAVVGSEAGILCPVCFVQAAEARGVGPGSWELRPDPAFGTEEERLIELQQRHGLDKEAAG